MTVPKTNLLSRRDAMAALTASGTTFLTGCASRPTALAAAPILSPPSSISQGAPNMPFAKALAGNNQIRPLPFKATALNGISEKMIVSHHENNYGGAVKNLNKAEQQLAQVNTDTPPFVVAGLHQSEVTFRNSKTLHEAYFGNLGGNGKRSGAIDKALAEAYGSVARWEEHFRALGTGLGGGSGWAILELELTTGDLRIAWSGHHTQTLATAYPLLVLDMYEHSYHMDFGAAAARYIDAFFANVNWDEVNRRLERGLEAAKTLRA
jgi:Fe-Mn family superoxide dismutase